MLRLICVVVGCLPTAICWADWSQGPGAHFDFTAPESAAPTQWSVVQNANIAWKTSLPETGQSAPVVVGNRIFVTTMKPVEADSATGSDIVAWCLSTTDGKVLWQRDIPGTYQTRLSAPFGDASSPAAVSDGQRVWFLNPTGRLVCFDLQGNELWSKRVVSVARTRPILHEGTLILHRQVYLPDEGGKFGHENANAGRATWTQLQALNCDSGKPVWLSECGVNMGCVPLLQQLSDGTQVLVVGRGGGHGPPEKPEGISMIRADNGKTVWTLPLEKFMSTQTYPVVNDQVLVFHRGEHLWVNAKDGSIVRRVSIVKDVPVRRWTPEGRTTAVETLPEQKPRSITQQSNLRVGNFHYFRAYTRNYVGRVDLDAGTVQYLEMPIQVLRELGKQDRLLWRGTPVAKPATPSKKREPVRLRANAVRNARGMLVMGDKRSQGTGWGHVCAPIPTAAGNRLVIPLMSGNVFVIQTDAKVFDERAVLAINDLGPLGQSFTRASITVSGNRWYAHTIRELIAIGEVK